MNTRLAVLALATAALAACEPNPSVTGPAAALQAARAADVSAAVSDPGAVYTLTNQVGGNAVAVFARGADGRLTAAGTVSTGGTGTGTSLGSQSAVTLSDDGRWLFAVNAGSNDVSVFSVSPAGGLALASRTAAGRTLPISLTGHGNALYVLNAGGTGHISGLAVGTSGALTAIAGTTLPLSGSNVGPAQGSFSPDGRRLVVTEKNTNQLDVYALDANGVASGPTTTASAGGTPFGFSFGLRNELFVSEATGSASSYERSEEHTSELQSRLHLVCRLLLEKKKKHTTHIIDHGVGTPLLHFLVEPAGNLVQSALPAYILLSVSYKAALLTPRTFISCPHLYI